MIQTGWFLYPESHHKGWFKVFRFNNGVEVWFGHRWIMIGFK